MPAFTDDPATASTHIRAVHINELRRDVAYFRQQAGLSPITWIDGAITLQTHVRAAHFTQLASAIQDL